MLKIATNKPVPLLVLSCDLQRNYGDRAFDSGIENANATYSHNESIYGQVQKEMLLWVTLYFHFKSCFKCEVCCLPPFSRTKVLCCIRKE